MRGFFISSSIFMLCVGGCRLDDDGTIGHREAIVGGTFEMGEPAVVAVEAFAGIGLCTGTLISPHVVLTAKHCVQAPGADRPFPASTISVGFGSDTSIADDLRVIAVSTTPGVYTSMPGAGLGGDLVGVDVAAITLQGPVADVTPIPVGREVPAVGSEFTAVGFGQRPGMMDSGLKYTTSSRIASITGNVLNTSMTICPGDSGGPAIVEGPPRSVVGVASFAEADQCPSSFDGYNLVEPFLGLIDAAVIAAGDCALEGEETCNSIDDDCDGMVDEGCSSIGDPCTADDECAFAQLPARFDALDSPAFCGDTPAGSLCTRSCAPTKPAASCAFVTIPFTEETSATPGVYCAATDGCEGACVPGTAGALVNGEACTDDTECASLRCVDPGDGARRCLLPCVGDAGLCPVSEVCAAASGSCGACVGPELVSSPRGLGERCVSDADCASGTCYEEGGRSYCSRDCGRDDECGDGFHCRDVSCATGARSGRGEPCVTAGDCPLGDTCPEGYCTNLCSTDGSCPEGFRCDGGLCGLDPSRAIIGQRCADDAACTMGSCLEVGDGTRCTRACGGAGTCPAGLECRRVEAGLLCVSPDVVARIEPRGVGGGGGCSTTGGTGTGGEGLLWVVVLAGLMWPRRSLRSAGFRSFFGRT